MASVYMSSLASPKIVQNSRVTMIRTLHGFLFCFVVVFWSSQGTCSSWAKYQIQAAVVTYSTAAEMLDPLTHSAWLETEPGMLLIPLHQNEDYRSLQFYVKFFVSWDKTVSDYFPLFLEQVKIIKNNVIISNAWRNCYLLIIQLTLSSYVWIVKHFEY